MLWFHVLGHNTPESRSSLDISNSIYEYVTISLLDNFSNIIVLGCDGTVVNIGVFNGVYRRLELKLQSQSNGLSAYFISTSCHYDTYLSP
ncbi:hypothetical protein AVEN_176517-1 [Araneus ventricosus]|uniref:Uncharacterized protein n=1 Tax=Araneus ventricosus TaxID=182803 RepID=A0A4Y2Q1G9_ARAVE|nr:hypothetical protein AVEN_35677-1 [Araneus ventricosus]GBN57998.1 hypothetical protein AVEN_176517-1 [Araneus ventricosus]